MPDKKGFLLRIKSDDTRTLGILHIFSDINLIGSFVTLELPWNNNQIKKSCIYPGKYNVIPIKSPTHGNCFEIENVTKRKNIQIHVLNFPKETEGCIGIGKSFEDIDGDKKLDIKSSTLALNELRRLCPEGFTLSITN